MVKHPWPLLEISLSDFRRLATLDMNTYLRNSMRPIFKTENLFYQSKVNLDGKFCLVKSLVI